MNAPAMPGRGPRVEVVLAGAMLLVALVVVAGFLFDLPYGFGGWELAIVAAPVVVAGLVVAGLLHVSGHGKRRRPGPHRDD